jgi:hypothetical protein
MQITPRILAMALKVGPLNRFASLRRPGCAHALVPKFNSVLPLSDAMSSNSPEELWH